MRASPATTAGAAGGGGDSARGGGSAAPRTGPAGWRRRWRREQRAWRRQRRAAYWAGGWTADPRYPAVTAPAAYGTRLITGLMVPVLSLASILFFGVWAVTIVSLVTRGHVFGQPLPDNMPLWMVILGLAVVYHAIAWPLRLARRRAAYYSFGGSGLLGAWDGLMGLAAVLAIVWFGYYYVPELREIVRSLPDIVDSFVNSFG